MSKKKKKKPDLHLAIMCSNPCDETAYCLLPYGPELNNLLFMKKYAERAATGHEESFVNIELLSDIAAWSDSVEITEDGEDDMDSSSWSYHSNLSIDTSEDFRVECATVKLSERGVVFTAIPKNGNASAVMFETDELSWDDLAHAIEDPESVFSVTAADL